VPNAIEHVTVFFVFVFMTYQVTGRYTKIIDYYFHRVVGDKIAALVSSLQYTNK